jgi:hypothetical protein
MSGLLAVAAKAEHGRTHGHVAERLKTIRDIKDIGRTPSHSNRTSS